MSKKITEEEVTTLRSLQKKLYDSRLDLGDIQVAMSRLETRQKSLVFDIENQSAEFGKFQEGLHTKYGGKKIDLMTGELK
tara:strand:- start:637 stop:876 length:240 start_codon:yes stop_codon:yes gene_type:complete